MARLHHQYSSELKQRLVEEIGARQPSLRYAQTSVAMVQVWLREYGQFQPKRDIIKVVIQREQVRIAGLEKALAEAHLKLPVYDQLITQMNKWYTTDHKEKWVVWELDDVDRDGVYPTFTDAHDAIAAAIHRDNTIHTLWSLERQTPYAVISQAT